MSSISVDDLVVRSLERVAHLRALAAERRRVGWEVSDVMTPPQLEALSDDVQRLTDALARWKSIADTREEKARINHAAYESLRTDAKLG